MQKAIRHILPVMGRILFIGLSLRVILGVVWIVANLGSFQEFGDSLFYLEVSETLLFDEYTGALYPVLLMLARGIEGLLRIPYTYVIQVLQLIIAGYAGYFFLGKIGVKDFFFKIWGSFVFLTFPVIAQSHLAILPNSLAFSAFLAEMAFVLEAVQRREPLRIRQLFYGNLFWLTGALLVPEYLYLGAVPVLLLLVYDICRYRKQQGKRIFANLILIVAFAGMIVGVNHLVQQEGACGRPAKTVDAALFRRFAWTSLSKYYGEWSQEMRDACPYDLMLETAQYADNMEELLQPQLENAIGSKQAQEYYRQVWKYALAHNMRNNLHEIAWDVVSYTLPTVSMQMLLEGRGYDSYVGRNYEIMRQETPKLTKWYVDYSCWWFVVGIIITFGMEIGMLLLKKKYGLFSVMMCMLVSGAFVVWYAMQGAGMWDYKNTLFTGAMWLLWMILAIRRGIGCDNDCP